MRRYLPLVSFAACKNEPAAVAVRGKVLSHEAQGISRGDGAEGFGELVGVGRR
jgi:hypothetical protein